jgi:hypothetical protein
VNLAFGLTSGSSCGSSAFTGYYYTNNFGSTGSLYTNAGGTVLAPAGWYKRDLGGGSFATFQWDGTQWISALDCP